MTERTTYVIGSDGQRVRQTTSTNPNEFANFPTQPGLPGTDTPTIVQRQESTMPVISLSNVEQMIEHVLMIIQEIRETGQYPDSFRFAERSGVLTDHDIESLETIYLGLHLHAAWSLAIIMRLARQHRLIQTNSSQLPLPNFATQLPEHPSQYFSIGTPKSVTAWQELVTHYIQVIAHSQPRDALTHLHQLIDVWNQSHTFLIHIKGTGRSDRTGHSSSDPHRIRETVWQESPSLIHPKLSAILRATDQLPITSTPESVMLEPRVRLELHSDNSKLGIVVQLDTVYQQADRTIGLELKSGPSHYDSAISRGKIDLQALPPYLRLELLAQILATLALRQRYFTAKAGTQHKIRHDSKDALYHKLDVSVGKEGWSGHSCWDELFTEVQAVELHLLRPKQPVRRSDPPELETVVIRFDDRMLFEQTITLLCQTIEELNDPETKNVLSALRTRTQHLTPKFEVVAAGPEQGVLI